MSKITITVQRGERRDEIVMERTATGEIIHTDIKQIPAELVPLLEATWGEVTSYIL